jgi:parallel beta-helix repeat protein
MKTRLFLLLIISLILGQTNYAQVFYIDSEKGNDMNAGDVKMPFKTIQKAIEVTNKLTGNGNITIKMEPGLYLLHDKIDINPVRILDENSKLTIESAIIPGDSLWTPLKMPVIISCSKDNSETQFKHSTGFLVASGFVEFRGIKFFGNANPSVRYYYPITRENPNLRHLVVSQCVFIGDKNSSIIQGGIWAHGADININHNVFYQCRNAILLFQNINNSIISNNIIYGAYESAFWMGDDANFKFENNIVSNCDYFWIGNPDSKIEFKISNSIISENHHFRGNWGRTGLTENKQKFIENNINKKDKISLVERDGERIPQTHLHITPKSTGYDLHAGIFE